MITAKRKRGQLILTEVRAARFRLDAVIDTGSEITIGNSALREKLLTRGAKFWEVEAIGVTGVIEGFEGHAAGHRTVADHGHDVEILPLEVAPNGHAISSRNRGGSVPCTESVVFRRPGLPPRIPFTSADGSASVRM